MAKNEQVKCPTLIARVPSDNEPGSSDIIVYSEGEGLDVGLDLNEPSGSLLGYDDQSEEWVFLDVAGTVPDGTACFLTLARNREKRQIKITGLPKGTPVRDAKLCGGRVWFPWIDEGTLVVHSYDLTGRHRSTRRLPVPGSRMGSLANSITFAVACNGYVAAVLRRTDRRVAPDEEVRKGDWGLYVFDDRGQVIAKLPGDEAHFSADGRSIAYAQIDINYASVSILDLRTQKTKVVKVWPPESADRAERADMEAFDTFRWDSKNGWLLCMYEGGSVHFWPVHAVDISRDRPVWHTLPISVDYANWTVLNEVPLGLASDSTRDGRH